MNKIISKIFIVLFFNIFLFLLTSIHSDAFTAEENINIDIYKAKSSGVVNITTNTAKHKSGSGDFAPKIPASGTIIDKKGYVLTNYHVIEGAEDINIIFHDTTIWKGEVLGIDPNNDIALIGVKIPANKLTVIEFADSDKVEVGQRVLAIGNPFGLKGTLTTGVVSSLNRKVKAKNGKEIHDIIQTDASINPGNSGGPLLDTNGYMIGLNTALLSTIEGSIGIGFAISSNRIKKVLLQLLQKGYISRSWLGILGQDINADLAHHLSLNSPGILISDVLLKSPAEKAGLRGGEEVVDIGGRIIAKGGDLIVSVDGIDQMTMDKLTEYIESRKINDLVKLTILRNSKLVEVGVRLIEEPR